MIFIPKAVLISVCLNRNIWASPSARGKAEGRAALGSASLRFFSVPDASGTLKELNPSHP